MLEFVEAYSRVVSFLKKWGRKRQDVIFRMPAGVLKGFGVSPNDVSILSMFFVFLSSIFIIQENRLYLVALSGAILLDMLDGTLARMMPKNHFGGVFDFFIDRFSDCMLLLSFSTSGLLAPYFSVVLLFFYALSTLFEKLLDGIRIRVYVLSFRIFMMVGLFLQEIHPKAVLAVACLLLINYMITSLSALPKVAFKT